MKLAAGWCSQISRSSSSPVSARRGTGAPFRRCAGGSVGSDRRGDRQAALRLRLAELGLDALLVSHAPNIRYLTGFTGSAGLLLVTAGRSALITDARYAQQAPEEARGTAEV